MEGVGKDRGKEGEKEAWKKRDGRAIFPNSNPRKRKEKNYEDILPQKHLNTPLT
jgi:hypothetical protein